MAGNEKEDIIRLPPIEVSDFVSNSGNTSAAPSFISESETDDFFDDRPVVTNQQQRQQARYDYTSTTDAERGFTSELSLASEKDHRLIFTNRLDEESVYTPTEGRRTSPPPVIDGEMPSGVQPIRTTDTTSAARPTPDSPPSPRRRSGKYSPLTPDVTKPLSHRESKERSTSRKSSMADEGGSSRSGSMVTDGGDSRRSSVYEDKGDSRKYSTLNEGRHSRKASILHERAYSGKKKVSVSISLVGTESTDEAMPSQHARRMKDLDELDETTSRDTVDTSTSLPKKKSRRLAITPRGGSGKSMETESGEITPPPAPRPRPTTRRFRKIAMKVMMNLLWREDLHLKHGAREEPFVVKIGTGRNQENLMFDVNDFRVTRSHGGRSGGGLSQRCIEILSISPQYRTEEELQYLKEVIPRLTCFDKYNLRTKAALSRVVCYDNFGDGRIVVQQGGDATATFYILSGTVRVTVNKTNPYTGLETTIVVGELTEGNMFGDVALTKNSKRNATCTCRGPCEFLRVEKDDFMSVLHEWHQLESAEVKKAFRWLPQFMDWTRDQVNSTMHASHMAEFPPHKIIAGELASKSEMVHFIVGGECKIIREVVLLEKRDCYNKKYYQLPPQNETKSSIPRIAPPRPDASITSRCKKVSRFWSLGKLNRGHYFGVGEMVPNTHIITNLTVQCLQVPRSTFTRIGQGAQLARMRNELESALPTPRDISSRYLETYRWARYKERLVKKVTEKRGYKCNTQITDVPLALRKENPSTHIRIIIPTERNKKKWSIFTAAEARL